jgi:hypothetical protein
VESRSHETSLCVSCLMISLACGCSPSAHRVASSGSDSHRRLTPTTQSPSSPRACRLASAHARQPVLGDGCFFPEYDKASGWGVVKPKVVSNQGDGASFVYAVRWRQWGKATAYGWGKRHAFKPHPGKYTNYVHGLKDELRASDLGVCHGRLAYRTLFTRQAERPGGPMTRWQSWTIKHGPICGTIDDPSL